MSLKIQEHISAVPATTSFLLAFLLVGCGNETGSSHEFTRADVKIDSDLEVKNRCFEGIELSKEIVGKGAAMMAAVEDAHKAAIIRTEAAYTQTIGNPTFEGTGAGVTRAMEIENEAKDAKIASLKEQASVAGALTELEAQVNSYSHQERLRKVSDTLSSTKEVCASAVALLRTAKKNLRNVREVSNSAGQLADENTELVEATLARITEDGVGL